jgi:Zn-dependent protease with chaperone function
MLARHKRRFMQSARDPYLTRFYTRMRAWGALISLGLNLFLLWLGWGLVFQFDTLLPDPGPLSVAVVGVVFFWAVAVVHYPVDCMFGYALERYEGRMRQGFGRWQLDWLAGNAVLIGVQIAGFFLLGIWLFNERFQMAGMLGLPVLLMAAKAFQFYWIPPGFRRPVSWDPEYRRKMELELRRLGVPVPADRELFLYCVKGSPGLNGGHAGLGPWCRLMVADCAPQTLEPRELAVLLAREIADLESGAGYRSLFAVLSACVVGLLAGLVTSIAFTPQGWPQLFWMAAFVSTWGVLCLPLFIWYSRRCVFAADARLLGLGVGKPELRSILKRVQLYNWSQWGSQDITISLFAAMPSLVERLQRLEEE